MEITTAMNKYLIMVTVAIMTAMNVNAQSGYEDTKHEIGITYGGMSTSTWGSIGETMGTLLGSLGTVSYDDGTFTGPMRMRAICRPSRQSISIMSVQW